MPRRGDVGNFIFTAESFRIHRRFIVMEALEAFDRSLELRPIFGKPWYLKALVLTNLERHEEALSAYERAGII